MALIMYLKNLIEWLEKQDQDADVIDGFGAPHSDRGDYNKLAFEPAPITTFGQMLAHAKSALGRTFDGYKGGEYLMDEYSHCCIGEYGSIGEDITSIHFKYWLFNSQGY
jgi:hypothetical protein